MRTITYAVLAIAVLHLLPVSNVQAQRKKDKNMLVELIRKADDSLLNQIVENPKKYQVQILYTQIDRDKQNKPTFTSYSYQVNSEQYFYPASTVKLPAALVALEKLNNLNIPGLTKYTPLKIDSAYTNQTKVVTDSSAAEGLPTLAHYIKKIFLVSDNDAYNRLYEFIGQRELNESLHQKGFEEVRLLHRLSVGDTGEGRRHTNPFTFYSGNKIIYNQPAAYNSIYYPNKLSSTSIGKGYYSDTTLINEPMDFSANNFISIESLQGILKSIMFPEAVPASQRFNLTPDDYTFLYRYMSMLPRESDYPSYTGSEYYDSYVKFLIFGDNKEPIPEHIRIFNKIGFAYGFVTENAYVVDFRNNVEFMLTAVILANEDMIFNSNDYQYDTVAFPFMAKLGNLLYQYELKRNRKHSPDLSRYKVIYKQQKTK